MILVLATSNKNDFLYQAAIVEDKKMTNETVFSLEEEFHSYNPRHEIRNRADYSEEQEDTTEEPDVHNILYMNNEYPFLWDNYF